MDLADPTISNPGHSRRPSPHRQFLRAQRSPRRQGTPTPARGAHHEPVDPRNPKNLQPLPRPQLRSAKLPKTRKIRFVTLPLRVKRPYRGAPASRMKTPRRHHEQGTINSCEFCAIQRRSDASARRRQRPSPAFCSRALSWRCSAPFSPLGTITATRRTFFAVGNYFLSLAIGIVFAAIVSRRIMARHGLTFLLVFACALSCVAWPSSVWSRRLARNGGAFWGFSPLAPAPVSSIWRSSRPFRAGIKPTPPVR